MPWKLVIYDWDGTLADSIRWSHRITGAIFSHFGLPVPSFADYIRNYQTTRNGFLGYYRARGLSDSVTSEELTALWLRFSLAFRSELELRPGALHVLRVAKIRRMHTAIVSSNTTELISSALAGFGVDRLIDYVKGYADEKAAELSLALAHFGVKPSEAVYVDDTPQGIRAALRVGMDTIAIEGGAGDRDELLLSGPGSCVKHLDDVVRLLSCSDSGVLEA